MYRKVIKRVLDIIISLAALIILSPVLLVVAILVRCKLGQMKEMQRATFCQMQYDLQNLVKY